jgi:dienelactone hydrolase
MADFSERDCEGETARSSGCSESGLHCYQTSVKFLAVGIEAKFMQTRDVDYGGEAVNLRGYLAWDETIAGPRPGVLVFHEGLGLGDFAMARARRLAELGYVALAADMFGDRRQARNLQEVANLVGSLRKEPEALRARGRAALATLAALPEVDTSRMAAIGFCFGGSVVLELARDGVDLRAVVSFHGVLTTQTPSISGQVKPSVLVLTGADDPLAPPEQVAAFENEMRAANVRDWQVISYGNTLHGFTNPAADGSMMRTALYSEQADRRSWASMRSLFDEVFGGETIQA